MPEANQSPSQEALLQKRLTSLIGSVRELALSDLELEDGDDEVTYKAADTDQPGRLIAQFSVAGIKDSYGDIITLDAFEDLNGKSLGMVWAHDRARTIGKGVVRMEGKKAIWDGNLFVGKNVPDAEMAHSVIKEMGRLQEYSWGFRIKEAKPIKEKGPDGQMYWNGGFEITKVSGIEVSPVLKGSHPKTKTISIKEEGEVAPQTDALAVTEPAAAPDTVGEAGELVVEKGMTVVQEYEAVLVAVSSFADRMKALDALRVEEKGRHLNAENLGRLKDLQDELATVQSQITDVLKTAEREQEVPIGDRFKFADAQRRMLELSMTTGD